MGNSSPKWELKGKVVSPVVDDDASVDENKEPPDSLAVIPMGRCFGVHQILDDGDDTIQCTTLWESGAS